MQEAKKWFCQFSAMLYEEAYLLNSVSRYDIHGKRLLESNEKVYWDDLGLRNHKADGSMDSYIEKVIENTRV